MASKLNINIKEEKERIRDALKKAGIHPHIDIEVNGAVIKIKYAGKKVDDENSIMSFVGLRQFATNLIDILRMIREAGYIIMHEKDIPLMKINRKVIEDILRDNPETKDFAEEISQQIFEIMTLDSTEFWSYSISDIEEIAEDYLEIRQAEGKPST